MVEDPLNRLTFACDSRGCVRRESAACMGMLYFSFCVAQLLIHLRMKLDGMATLVVPVEGSASGTGM
jgi:hypothetical protein